MGNQCAAAKPPASVDPALFQDNRYDKLPKEVADEYVARLIPYVPKTLPVDHEAMVMWTDFVKDKSGRFKKLVQDEKDAGIDPEKVKYGKYSDCVAWWYDTFLNKMVSNIVAPYPHIGKELVSRGTKQMMAILTNLMKLVLSTVVEEGGFAKIDHSYFLRIAGFHTKWEIEDAAYITIENACMDALRECAGGDKFVPAVELRLRAKYNFLKQCIQEGESFLKDKGLDKAMIGQRKAGSCPFAKVAEEKSKKVDDEKKSAAPDVKAEEPKVAAAAASSASTPVSAAVETKVAVAATSSAATPVSADAPPLLEG